MRIAMLAGACILAACASSGLAPAPPPGVDLSGRWTLDEADSDDAQRLLQSQLKAATENASGSGQTPSRRGGARPSGPTALGPVMPPVMVLDEGLHWPGKDVSIKQSGSVVTFSSGGSVRDCQLNPGKASTHTGTATRGRGDAPPPRCGWDQGTLVVQSGEPEEDHPPYEQRFSLSPDGQQLVEVVLFKGGRSDGFSASRVWNRATPTPGIPSSASPQ
jgi:hypothetical protein